MDTFAATPTPFASSDGSALARLNLSAMLSFDPPYLLDKLLGLGVAQTRDEARELFREVIKYFVLCELSPERELPMISRRIDETWHQFALFTRQYEQFCVQFFGGYVHHAPNEIKPYLTDTIAREAMELDEFQARYEALFGPISAAWFDENALHPSTRLAWESWVDKLRVEVNAGRAELILDRDEPLVLCRASARADKAYELIATQSVFLVRELPGLRTDGERIALCRPLVQLHVLHVAP